MNDRCDECGEPLDFDYECPNCDNSIYDDWDDEE